MNTADSSADRAWAPRVPWGDETSYQRCLHVAAAHPRAHDDNPGSDTRPFRTIGQATKLAQPGDKVIVHAGVYRETVRPRRGGTRPDRMISYEAAPNERVELTGAELWQPTYRPSTGWHLKMPSHARPPLWMAELPSSSFTNYHPFQVRNVYPHLARYGNINAIDWMERVLLTRGHLFDAIGPWRQVLHYRQLAQHPGAFWVEPNGQSLHLRARDDTRPPEELQFTAREQAFAPDRYGLGFLRVAGFHLGRVADGLPVPQRACMSTHRGHHWIIEDNHIAHANALGLDIGLQSWTAAPRRRTGHHQVRRNTITDCGIGGIAGAGGVNDCIIEHNHIQRIGFHDLEKIYECAAIKLHFARHTIIRANVLSELRDACGIWLDVDTRSCRITGNILRDIRSRVGGIYSELNYHPNLIDQNHLEAIALPTGPEGEGAVPCGVRADCNTRLTVRDNHFINIAGYALSFSRQQDHRKVRGRAPGRPRQVAHGNRFSLCALPLEFGLSAGYHSDHNVFDAMSAAGVFTVSQPAPIRRLSLADWRRLLGQDQHSTIMP